jgi:hypothetical protein
MKPDYHNGIKKQSNRTALQTASVHGGLQENMHLSIFEVRSGPQVRALVFFTSGFGLLFFLAQGFLL